MSNLALKSSALNIQNSRNSLDVVESIEQETYPALVAVDAGVPVQLDPTTGKWIKAIATAAGTCKNVFITLKQVAAGESVTAIRKGTIGGIDLSSLSYGADVFVSDTSGTLADAAGTATAKVGFVASVMAQRRGDSPIKVLKVDCP